MAQGYSSVINKSSVYVPLSTVISSPSFIVNNGPLKVYSKSNGSRFLKLLSIITLESVSKTLTRNLSVWISSIGFSMFEI